MIKYNIDYLYDNSENWLKYTILKTFYNEKIKLIDFKDIEKFKKQEIILKEELLKDSKIKKYLKDINNFHGVVVKGHKNPDLPIHKLLFLLDIGLDTSVIEINNAINEILTHKDENGVYQSVVNIPKHYGGSGEETFGWALCDAPLLLIALQKAGVDYDKYIKQGVEYLTSLFKKQGFLCTVSKELGKWRGPGKKDDCCPYATLIMLKLFSVIPEYKRSDIAYETAKVILDLWKNSLEVHPYMFYMGNDFRKLKAPAMWYDIVSVLDILSEVDNIKEDKYFLEMLNVIKSKQDEKGLFTCESVYQKFKGWEFGQKKIPSMYLTFLCFKILKKAEKNSKENKNE